MNSIYVYCSKGRRDVCSFRDLENVPVFFFRHHCLVFELHKWEYCYKKCIRSVILFVIQITPRTLQTTNSWETMILWLDLGLVTIQAPDARSVNIEIYNYDYAFNPRCDCGKCVPMPTDDECLCCQEISRIANMTEEREVTCITQDTGFIANCLNKDVLVVSVFEFCDHHGPIGDNEPAHE